eukprot:5386489-Prymnesium_polylepis.1
MRARSTRVLPVPGLASSMTAPLELRIASACSGFACGAPAVSTSGAGMMSTAEALTFVRGSRAGGRQRH